MTIRDIAIAFGYEIDKDSEKKANESINALKTKAGKILGAIGIGFSLTQINAMVEQYGAINQRLKSATSELENQKELQDKIMQTASNTLTSYETTAQAVASYVSQSKKVLKTSESALQFTELTTKAWKAAGREEAQIASLHDTLAKAFQKNIIDAGTFETLLSQTPETIGYLEESLGKSRTQLRAMAQAGVLTASHLTTAFTNSSDKINAAYAEAPMKITDALKLAKEKVALVLTQTDEGMEVTKTISKMIVKGTNFLVKGLKTITALIKSVTDKLGGTENALKLIAIILGSIFAVQQFKNLKLGIEVFKDMAKAAKKTNIQFLLSKLHIFAIIAAIVMLFLIIEDIIGFINGKDSVFGDILKKAGLDVEDIRGKLKDFYDKIKTKVTEIVDFLKGHGEGIIKGVMGVVVALGMLNLIIQTVKAGIAIYNGIMAAKVAIDTIATAVMGKLGVAGVAAAVGIGSIVVIVALVIAALALLVSWIVKNWDKIKAWLDSMKEKISSWWDDVKKKCSEKAKEISESIKSFFKGISDWFKDNWSALLLLIISPFAGALKLLYNNNDKFRKAVDDFVQKAKDKIKEFGTDIKTFFEELPSKALQWGRDMLQNFIQGIDDKFPGLKKAISFITNLIDGNLGHSVPDEGPLKDDDKWMPDFMQNLTVGLKKGIPNLRAVVKDIASVLSIVVNPNPSPVTQNIAQGSSATRIVNQYNNWTNHFNGGTKQEQSDLARSSDSQVKQASTKLGTELAYTR